jgi:hypothetical protein
MFSLGGKILDLYDDPSLQVLSKSPHFEKVASLPIGDPAKLADLEDRNFGVVFIAKNGEVIRKYPVHDFAHTVLANVYFDLTADKLPPEAKIAAASQIKRASVQFGVKPLPSVEKLAAETEEGRNYVRLDRIKVADYARVDVLGQLRDSYEENRDKYGREEKRDLAKAMKTAGVELPSDLKPFAIENASIDKEALFSQCAARKRLTPEQPEAALLMDEFLAKHAQFDPAETVKLLETFDRQFGLDQYWTRGLEPNTILMEKKATHQIPLRGIGRSFSEDELKTFVSSNGELIEKMFGKELADKVKLDPKEIWSLPNASREFVAARMEHARDNTPAKAE